MVQKVVNIKSLRDAKIDAEADEAELESQKLLDPNYKAPDPLDVPNSSDPNDRTDWKKRHSDLRSYTQKEINDLKKEVGTLRTQLTDAAQKQIKFPKTEAEVTEWVQKYPDVAAIVETIAMKKVADVRKEMADRDTVLQERAYEIEFTKHLNRINGAHSDFFDLRDEPDFTDWLLKQPKYVRVAFSDEPVAFDDLEDMADTVISALDLYKAKNPKKKPDNRREAAEGIPTRNSGPPKDVPDNMYLRSVIDKMPIREYEKHEEEILKAWKEGRIIDDVSGAAR